MREMWRPNENTLKQDAKEMAKYAVRAREILAEKLPGLNPGRIKIIEQTLHPYWMQAVVFARLEEEKLTQI